MWAGSLFDFFRGNMSIFISILILGITSLWGCEKNKLPDAPTAETPVPDEQDATDDEDPESDPDQADNPTIVVIGKGNGEKLVIDGTGKSYKCNAKIAIKGGAYAGIVIRNITGKSGCPVTITNDGVVVLSGARSELNLENLDHVIITGDGSSLSPSIKGFQFKNNDYRAIVIQGPVNHLTLQHMSFENIGDYVISSNFNPTYVASDASSFTQGLKFLHLKANNVHTFLQFPGSIGNGKITGLVKGVEIAHIEITNSPVIKNAVHFAAVEDYDIHHNEISNVNMGNNDHNAMFLMMGNGKFYNNFISNHQGNAIRAWAFSVGKSPKEVNIYNNIVLNSRKYSAFEIQSVQSFFMSGKTTFANGKVFNNTVGNLNTSKDWYGVVLDAYRLFGGKCEVFNNLAFNLPAPHPKSYIVSYMSIELADLKEENNLYYRSAADAGILDMHSLKLQESSPVKNAGIALPFSITDFYNQLRKQNNPSIGAVE